MTAVTPATEASRRVEDARDLLLGLSHRIHAHPETAFEEERAAAWLCEALDEAGFAVTPGVCDLPTAFTASFGSGPLELAICAEYDALPGIGHACGHNIIAGSAVGAALALAPLADDLGITVRVVGTPAEEGGGGKVLLLERGAFDGVHAAMMMHPGPFDIAAPQLTAMANLEVHYHGRAAHAAVFPQDGVNAADALTVAQTAIGLLRQHIAPSDRVHGIVTHGGEAPNIVPGHTSASYYVRAVDVDELARLEPRVRDCLAAGALATGCRLEIVDHPHYADLRVDAELTQRFRGHAEALGRSFDQGDQLGPMGGSTDMGNVSHALPSIHPVLGIDSLPAMPHTPEFTPMCITASADTAVLDGSLLLALTAIDAATEQDIRQRLLAGNGTAR